MAMSGIKRLIEPKYLPSSLWDAENEILHISPSLALAYETMIDRHGLRDLGKNRDPKDAPIGGESRERSDQHFAQQFDGSVARVQLALTDPQGAVPAMSNGIVKNLSGNRVTLTDAPCGAGAAAFALLCAIAELRANNVLPREPLDVLLLGAELSEHARAYAEEILVELLPVFEDQGIFVDAKFGEWDATCPVSTAKLVKRMNIASTSNPKILLVVANFSGFLTTSNKWKHAKNQVRDLFLHGSGGANFAAWIEPLINKVTGDSGLYTWIRKALKGEWRPFAKERVEAGEPQPVATTSTRFRLPLSPTETARVGLAVMPIDLVRSK
jgi:hypothetical protein